MAFFKQTYLINILQAEAKIEILEFIWGKSA